MPDVKHSSPSSRRDEAAAVQLDRLEARFGDLQQQVRRLQRMASLGTMSAMLAHEINNIMTPIVSYCQVALASDDTALLRKAVSKSHAGAARLIELCDRIMGMAGDRSDDAGAVELGPVVDDAAACLGQARLGRLQIEVGVPPGLRVLAHRGSLQQVVLNLLINARQAMADRAGRVVVSAGAADGAVRMEVVDNGPGIAPEHLDRVFEPFFSTKAPRGRTDQRGLGLGLHICRQLLTDMGGSIEVASRRGEGATFTITLPLA